ncbi:MAG: hypothetical protein IJV01_02760 [Bacteroidales bacterium]|nr:hypothetical protein [Bacteroidales bacterium]
MKTTKLFIGMATVVLAFAACSKINPAPQERSLEPFTLSAGAAQDENDDVAQSPAARTYSTWSANLATRSVRWNSDDELSVFDSEGANNRFSLSSEAGQPTADFSGSISAASTADFALFPYDSNASISGTTISTTIPSDQVLGNEQSWGVNCSVAVGAVSAGKAALKNVCGLIRLTVPNYHVYSVTLSAKENLAGDVEIDCSGEAPSATIVANGSKSVTYRASKAGKSIYASTFWFCVLPGSYTGITVTVKYSDGRADSVFGDAESSATLTVARSQTTNLGILDIADEVITLDFTTNIFGDDMKETAMSYANAAGTLREENGISYRVFTGTYDGKEYSWGVPEAREYKVENDTKGVVPSIYWRKSSQAVMFTATTGWMQFPAISGKKLVAMGVTNANGSGTNSNGVIVRTTDMGTTVYSASTRGYAHTPDMMYFSTMYNKTCQDTYRISTAGQGSNTLVRKIKLFYATP